MNLFKNYPKILKKLEKTKFSLIDQLLRFPNNEISKNKNKGKID